MTDRAGHSGDPELVFQCLETLERFLPLAADFGKKENQLFLLCSDHGNIEDSTTKSHTRNPVPLMAIGAQTEQFKKVKDLTGVVPAILACYSA
jgi:bisphosphoglycerate-independent phosphoglycerate mutase (AlkP superfamily)